MNVVKELREIYRSTHVVLTQKMTDSQEAKGKEVEVSLVFYRFPTPTPYRGKTRYVDCGRNA
jgi:hypothetical protein